MRVTIVSPFDPAGDPRDRSTGHVGGVEGVLAASARALARRGTEVTVLSTSRRPGRASIDGVRHVRVRRFATLFRTPMSAAFLHPLDADVVHVPATYPLYSDLLVARASRGTATVLDYHFDVHAEDVATRAAASAWSWTLARCMRRAHVVLARTEEYARASPALRWVPGERLRIVPNGVDPARFRLRTAKERSVLCVGRLVPYKGVETLVRACALLQRETDAPLVVAGDGPLRARLEGLAEDLGVDATFLGYVPDDELPALFGRAGVTVLPSVNGQEAFGVALLESLASGTPVVASDLPGVREVASLGGLVVPPADERALARAVRAVLDGEANLPGPATLRRRVLKRHAWDAIAQELLAAYARAEAVRCGS